jgi:dienelactone hydrolase
MIPALRHSAQPGFRGVGICVLFLAVLAPADCGDSERFRRVVSTFRSSGKTVRVDEFRPLGSGHAPLVLLLHGSAGPESGNFPYRTLAATLANRGWAVQIPHYFEVTKPNRNGSGEPYGIWIRALRDEIDGCRRRSDIDASKVVLIGFSLGASLVLAAVSDGLPVSAIVECAGSLPDVYFTRLRDLPPTLILHNRGDPVMPVSNAEQLIRLCDTRHYLCEAHFGSGAAHGLPAPESESVDRIVQFISAHIL